MERGAKKDHERFNSHIRKEGECWLWTDRLDKDGYGTFWFARRARRAHRFAYWALVGDIPDGAVVDHICKKRSCVRPEHLRCLSSRENILLGDGHGALNARRALCKNGHPFDRVYGTPPNRQRYCSICAKAKTARLRAKWLAEPDPMAYGMSQKSPA